MKEGLTNVFRGSEAKRNVSFTFLKANPQGERYE